MCSFDGYIVYGLLLLGQTDVLEKHSVYWGKVRRSQHKSGGSSFLPFMPSHGRDWLQSFKHRQPQWIKCNCCDKSFCLTRYLIAKQIQDILNVKNMYFRFHQKDNNIHYSVVWCFIISSHGNLCILLVIFSPITWRSSLQVDLITEILIVCCWGFDISACAWVGDILELQKRNILYLQIFCKCCFVCFHQSNCH